MKTKVIIKEQRQYILSEIVIALHEIFTELHIFEKLKDTKRVLLKPNLLGAHTPDKAVTTHPVVLEAVIKILKNLDKEIIVGDSPGGTVKASHVWKMTGIAEVCIRHDVRLIDFGKEGVVNVKTNIAKFFIDKNVLECDAIINIAKMKTHSLMLYTGAVKNLYGTIPGLYKTELHKDFPTPNDFAPILSSIYGIVKSNIILNIIDGIVGMEGEGPAAGTPYPFGILIASEKASAADYAATQMMGFDFNNIHYLKQSLSEDNILVAEIDINKKYKNFKYPGVQINKVIFRYNLLNKIPNFLINAFKGIFSFYPAFKNECEMCMLCVQSCPAFAIEKNKNKLSLKKNKCIKCLCCHELCPISAIYLKKSMLARFVLK